MLKSLSFRINLTILVVATVIVAAFGGYDYSRDNKTRITQLREDLASAVGRLSTTLATPLWGFNYAELESIARGEMLNDDIVTGSTMKVFSICSMPVVSITFRAA